MNNPCWLPCIALAAAMAACSANHVPDESADAGITDASADTAPGDSALDAPADASLDAPDLSVPCGNGVLDDGEECDGLVNASCADFGFNAGFPRCTESCDVDTARCTIIRADLFAAYDDTACAVIDGQSLQCWGSSDSGTTTPAHANALRTLSTCEQSSSAFCGVTDEGEVRCSHPGLSVLPLGNDYTDVWCAKHDGSAGVVIAKTAQGELVGPQGVLPALAPGARVRDVFITARCVWLESGEVLCATPEQQALFGSTLQARLWMGDLPQRFCGVELASGHAWCRSIISSDVFPSVPSQPSGHRQIVAFSGIRSTGGMLVDEMHMCTVGLSGELRCDPGYEAIVNMPPPDLRFTAIGVRDRIVPSADFVGLATDGKLYMWGRDALKSWEGPFTSLSGSWGRVCAFASVGRSICFPGGSSGEDRWSNLLETPTDISVSSLLACGVYEDGALECWGSYPLSLERTFPGHHAKNVFVSSMYFPAPFDFLASAVCIRDVDNLVHCDNRGYQNFVVPPEEPMVSVAYDSYIGCYMGIDAEGVVHRWGNAGAGEPFDNFCDVLPHADGYRAVSSFESILTCGLRLEGNIECSTWNDEYPVLDLPESDWIDLAVNGDVVCALKANGAVSCFTYLDSGGTIEPRVLRSEIDAPGLADPIVSLRGGGALYGMHASGRPVHLVADALPGRDTTQHWVFDPWTLAGTSEVLAQAALAGPPMCLRHTDGRIRCGSTGAVLDAPYGTDTTLYANRVCWRHHDDVSCAALTPDSLDGEHHFEGAVSELAQSRQGLCVVLEDGAVQCLASEGGPATFSMPTELGYHSLRASAERFCAVSATADARCWTGAEELAPALTGPFSMVDPARDDTCALMSSNRVRCDGLLREQAPRDISTATFTDIQAEGALACAIRTDRHASCWGTFSSGRSAKVELILHDDERLVASSQSVCRVGPDAPPRCFGAYNY